MQASGGLGLFLLGMIVMTDGLRALAGSAMRAVLIRFTRSPISGAMTGAASTAILQSSSATTVAAVGFVGAGLITFPESLGIIFGANIGTTLKGWIIALFGFKFPLGTMVLPVILLGAILRLFGRGKAANVGYALAGFGLIFVGITLMQQGMGGLADIITPETLPPDTLVGRLQLVAFGILITIITQYSSAGVAATLTALFAGAINFEQAAALVIGMDVGTTVTAVMATIGGSVAARRTGLSHVIYNLFTACGALILITPYTLLWENISPGALAANAEIALVAFHTSFNTLGAIVILPFTGRFAHLIEKLVPEKKPSYTGRLGEGLLEQPKLALTAVQASIHDEFLALLRHVNAILGDNVMGRRADLTELQEALDETHAYIDRIHLHETKGAEWERMLGIVHTLDHMQRLHERCEEEEDRAITARDSLELSDYSRSLVETINGIFNDIETKSWTDASQRAAKTAAYIHDQVEPLREAIMAKIARDEIHVPEGTVRLEAIRWLKRVSKHIARVMQHYSEAELAAGK
jgi:phosphate:Na+ symporter